MKSCLVRLKEGDQVIDIETGKEGIIRDIKIVPNGHSNTSLVAILCVEMELFRGRGIKSATSNNFRPLDDFDYEEFYPSVNCSRVSDKCFPKVDEDESELKEAA